jgi:hypothetical protein
MDRRFGFGRFDLAARAAQGASDTRTLLARP